MSNSTDDHSQTQLTQVIIRQLGQCDYQPTWSAMHNFAVNRQPEQLDEIWLLQHPPVFTLGQAGKKEHILKRSNIDIVETDRGGQVTYHGPGQLVAYLMIDLKRKQWSSRELVSRLETTLVSLLQTIGIQAHSRADAPGVYTEDGRKIASLGLRIKRQSSYHGLALNCDMDLSPFQDINPCGYQNMKMTQVVDFTQAYTIDELQSRLINELMTKLEYTDSHERYKITDE